MLDLKADTLSGKLVVKANQLIEAAYKLSLQEARIILVLVSQINKEDTEFKDYYIDVKDFINILGLKGKSAYKEVEKITKKLNERVLEIEDIKENTLLQISWVSSAKYFRNEGYVRLRFDPDLMPYLLAVKSRFTQYTLLNVVKLRSVYSIRIYELLKQYEKIGERVFLLSELKSILGLGETEYQLFGHFNSKVLEQATKEINLKTDIKLEYEAIKKGRKVHKIKFLINPVLDQKKELPNIISEEEKKLIEKLINYFSQAPKIAKEHVKKVPKEKLIEILKTVERRYKEGKINDLGAYTAYAIENDIRDQRSLFEEEELTKKATEEKQREEQLSQEQEKEKYDLFRTEQLKKSFDELPEEEQEELLNEAESIAIEKYGSGIGLKKTTQIELNQIVEKQINFPTFEEWQRGN